jgi:hypothetical protein
MVALRAQGRPLRAIADAARRGRGRCHEVTAERIAECRLKHARLREEEVPDAEATRRSTPAILQIRKLTDPESTRGKHNLYEGKTQPYRSTSH